MLKELIKISQKNNHVVYATHSIFMIDRENYNRHVYLKKKNERTSINPSQINRIGFFMQEEVLHKSLNIDLSKDFNSTNIFNFVFEGDGDVNLFKYFYEKVLKKPPLDKKNCSFYQGGKCNDIRNYLFKNPIQLGTKWIFILDKDLPANNLKDFITSRYKNYIDKDLFIFQYENENKPDNNIIELEDLIPIEIINESYSETLKALNILDDFEEFKSDGLAYSSYNDKILNSFLSSKNEKEIFKANFKKLLNDKIKNKLDSINDPKGFENAFSEYSTWVNKAVVEQLK